MGKLNINVNIFPKSGYVFKDANGVTHIGDSWKTVIRKVAAYRRRQGLPIGDVAGEVKAQACAREPAICREETDEQQLAYRKVSIKGMVLAFLARCREARDKGQLHYVAPHDAANRANVCAGCPLNTPMPGGCGSCRAARAGAQKYVLQGRAADQRLNGCLVLGEDMGVAAWLDRVNVDVAALPGHCWRKKVL